MSPEWMIVVDRMQARARPRDMNRLSDPLEGREWQGIEWAALLFGRLSNMDGRAASTAPRPETGRTAGRPARHSSLLPGHN